jgi:hypothetical protein
MAFYIILVVAVVLFLFWFLRTSIFRAHLHGHGRDPGNDGTRMEGRFPGNGGSYDYDGRP